MYEQLRHKANVESSVVNQEVLDFSGWRNYFLLRKSEKGMRYA